MTDLRLILVDPNGSLCKAWQQAFEGLPNVEVFHGYFQDVLAYDCLVSPANSFGLMDGGVDAAITRYFGDQLMHRVQQRILAEFLGEQPVGTSIIVETNDPEHLYLAHSPTMRVPMEISRTDNVYLAMWATLLAVWRHNQQVGETEQIATLACPGLGTGYGKVPHAEASRQMALAYRNYLSPPAGITWTFASGRQNAVRYGGDMGFHFPPQES